MAALRSNVYSTFRHASCPSTRQAINLAARNSFSHGSPRSMASVVAPPVTQDATSSKGPTAMVFMNMGGPSTTDEVGSFLSRLFVCNTSKVLNPRFCIVRANRLDRQMPTLSLLDVCKAILVLSFPAVERRKSRSNTPPSVADHQSANGQNINPRKCAKFSMWCRPRQRPTSLMLRSAMQIH